MGYLPWNEWIVLALFLVGMGAGSYMIAYVMLVRGADVRRIRSGFYLSAPLVVLGLLILLFDLGRPERFINVLLHFNPESMMNLGAFIQGTFVHVALLVAWWVYRGEMQSRRFKIVSLVGLVLAVAVGLYHGLLPASMPREGWNGALVAVMFLSSLLSGKAAIELSSGFSAAHHQHSSALLFAYAALLGVWFYTLFIGHVDERAVLAFLFGSWGLSLLFGAALLLSLLLPFTLTCKPFRGAVVLAALFEFGGAFMFKYGAILAGQLSFMKGL